MKMLAFLLALICAVAAVMYYTMPAGSLPAFVPGHVAGSPLIHMKHAIAAAAAAIVFLIIGLFIGRRAA